MELPRKIRRIVKSTLAAETLSMVDGLDMALFVEHMLTEITKRKVPIECFIDNKSLFDNIHSTKLVDEKRLRIDIASIKQMKERHEISSVRWITSDKQLANCLTKRGASTKELLSVLENGKFLDQYEVFLDQYED